MTVAPQSADAAAREAARLAWARAATGDAALELQRASVDAGFRSYWRAATRDGSRIVMDSPPALEDVRPWLRMRDLLEVGGVRVPQVLVQDVDAGFLLLEDLGGPTLAQVIDTDNADAHFDAAIGQLLRLQAIVPPQDIGEFGEALLHAMRGLFEEWFLRRHLGIELDCGDLEKLELVHRRLMDNALAQPRVLTHRDFMPRNLMPVADGPAVLDFQDCVLGPIAYDPISLFKDAFLSWPLERVDGWLAHYHARALAAGLPVPPLRAFPSRRRLARHAAPPEDPRHLRATALSRRQDRSTCPMRRASSPISTKCCRAIRSCRHCANCSTAVSARLWPRVPTWKGRARA